MTAERAARASGHDGRPQGMRTIALSGRRLREKRVHHGLSKTREYVTWCGVIKRCFNPRAAGYKRYGGRGITACARWQSGFVSFYEDMGQRPSAQHSIDRIDNDGHYSCGKCEECVANGWPANCRWATATVQDSNKRAHPRLVLLKTNDGTLTITQVATRLGLGRGAVHGRLRAGWHLDRVVYEPAAPCSAALKGKRFRSRAITHDGRTLSLKEWSRETGVHYGTLRARIARGVDFAEALRPTTTRHEDAVAAKLAVESCGGNKSRAAELLGIDRRTLYRHLTQAEGK